MDFKEGYNSPIFPPIPDIVVSSTLHRARVDAYKTYYTALKAGIVNMNARASLNYLPGHGVDNSADTHQTFLNRKNNNNKIILGFEEYYIFLEMLFVIDPKHDFILTASDANSPKFPRFDGENDIPVEQRKNIMRKIDKLLRMYDNRLFQEYEKRTQYRDANDRPCTFNKNTADACANTENFSLGSFKEFRDSLYKSLNSTRSPSITLGEKNGLFENWHKEWLIKLMNNLPYIPSATQKAIEAAAAATGDEDAKKTAATKAANMEMATQILNLYRNARKRLENITSSNTDKRRCAYLNAPSYDAYYKTFDDRRKVKISLPENTSIGNKTDTIDSIFEKYTTTKTLGECCKGNGFSFIDGAASGICSSLTNIANIYKNNGIAPTSNFIFADLDSSNIVPNDTIVYIPSPRCHTVYIMLLYSFYYVWGVQIPKFTNVASDGSKYYFVQNSILKDINTALSGTTKDNRTWWTDTSKKESFSKHLQAQHNITPDCFDAAFNDWETIRLSSSWQETTLNYFSCIVGIEKSKKSNMPSVRLLPATVTSSNSNIYNIKYTGKDSNVKITNKEACGTPTPSGMQKIVEAGTILNNVSVAELSVSINPKLPGGFEIGNTDITFICRENRDGQNVMQDIYTRFVTYFDYDTGHDERIYFNTELHRTYPYIDQKVYENVYIVEFYNDGVDGKLGERFRGQLNMPGKVEPHTDNSYYKFTQKDGSEHIIPKTQPLRSVSKHKFLIADIGKPLLERKEMAVQVNSETKKIEPVDDVRSSVSSSSSSSPLPRLPRDGSMHYWADSHFFGFLPKEEKQTLIDIRIKEKDAKAYYGSKYKCDLINTSRKAMCDFGQSLNMYLKTGGYIWNEGEFGNHILKGSPQIIVPDAGINDITGKKLSITFPGKDLVVSPTLVNVSDDPVDYPVVSIHNDRPAVVAAALLLKTNNYKLFMQRKTNKVINKMAHTCYPNGATYIFCNQMGNLTSEYFLDPRMNVTKERERVQKRKGTFNSIPGRNKKQKKGGGKNINQNGGGKVQELLNAENCDLYCLYQKEKEICDIFFTGISVFKYDTKSVKIYNSYLRYILDRSDKFLLSSDLNACAVLVSIIVAMEEGVSNIASGEIPVDSSSKSVKKWHNYRKIINSLPYDKETFDFFKISLNNVNINDEGSIIDYTEKMEENYNFVVKTMQDNININEYISKYWKNKLEEEERLMKLKFQERLVRRCNIAVARRQERERQAEVDRKNDDSLSAAKRQSSSDSESTQSSLDNELQGLSLLK